MTEFMKQLFGDFDFGIFLVIAGILGVLLLLFIIVRSFL